MVKPRENRIPIMMSDEELQIVDDWRYENRVATRSEAIRRLCKIAHSLDQVIPSATDHVEWLVHEARQLYDFALESQDRAARGEEITISDFAGYSDNILRRAELIYMILFRENNRIVPLSDEGKMSSAFSNSQASEDQISRIISAYAEQEDLYSDATAIKVIRENMSEDERAAYKKMTGERKMSFWTEKIAEYRRTLPAYSDKSDTQTGDA